LIVGIGRGEVLIEKGELCEVEVEVSYRPCWLFDWGLIYHFDGIAFGMGISKMNTRKIRKLSWYFKSFSDGCVAENERVDNSKVYYRYNARQGRHGCRVRASKLGLGSRRYVRHRIEYWRQSASTLN
jgi:hypothetical protein